MVGLQFACTSLRAEQQVQTNSAIDSTERKNSTSHETRSPRPPLSERHPRGLPSDSDGIPQSRYTHASLKTRTSMGLAGFQLLILLVVISLVSSDTTPATFRGVDGVSLTSDESTHFLPKRFLRDESTSDERVVPSSIDDEERMGVKEAVGWFWNAVKTRVKMKLWLYRGMTPEQVLEKLKVTSKTDKNYKYYSRYYFKYYVKYPGRVPSKVSAKTADDIMKARLSKWLEDNLTPPQVFKELGLTGTFASARGHPKYKYFDQYSKMWSDLQARLSKAENGR